MAVMEGADPAERLRGTYFEALKKNWMVWPAVQAVNFKFVPLEHRVLVVNVVSLGEFGGCFFFGCWCERVEENEREGGGGGGLFGEGMRGCLLIYVCVLCIGWNCYLSYVNSQGGKEKIDDVYEKEE